MLSTRVVAQAAKVVKFAERHNVARRPQDAWATLLGQGALYAFILTTLSGVILALWFEPSMARITYDGSYAPLRGVMMSEAYASTLDISFEIRGGLLLRQIHQWGALVFVAALSLFIVRIFLTGGFRKQGKVTWLFALGLLVAGMIDAYLGHLLPDDMLSGTSLRVIEGIVLAVPIIGTYLASLLFGGEFPGDDIITTLYVAHIALAVLITAIAVAQLWLAGRSRSRPSLRKAAWANGPMFMVFGVIVVMAATIQVNPVWLWGPFDPAQASAGSQPPWYMGFLDGAVRLMPGWDVHVFGYELVLSVLIPAMVVPGLMLAALALYPWLEQWAVGPEEPAGLDRARDMPVRSGLAAAFITFYLVLWIAAGNDIIATVFHIPLNWVTRFLQVAVIVLPPIAFWVTKRLCLGLQLRERDEMRHGRETGMVVVAANGEFTERREPISAYAARHLSQRPQRVPVTVGPATDANGVPNPTYSSDRRRARLSSFYFSDVPGPTDTHGEISSGNPVDSGREPSA